MLYWFRYHNNIVRFYLGLQEAWQLLSRVLTWACVRRMSVGLNELAPTVELSHVSSCFVAAPTVRVIRVVLLQQ